MLTGKAKTDYQREYMRQRRAAQKAGGVAPTLERPARADTGEAIAADGRAVLNLLLASSSQNIAACLLVELEQEKAMQVARLMLLHYIPSLDQIMDLAAGVATGEITATRKTPKPAKTAAPKAPPASAPSR